MLASILMLGSSADIPGVPRSATDELTRGWLTTADLVFSLVIATDPLRSRGLASPFEPLQLRAHAVPRCAQPGLGIRSQRQVVPVRANRTGAIAEFRGESSLLAEVRRHGARRKQPEAAANHAECCGLIAAFLVRVRERETGVRRELAAAVEGDRVDERAKPGALRLPSARCDEHL